MAQYDGSIRINTEILVKSVEKQLRALENNMEKTAEKAASLRDKMEALRTTQIPMQEYKDISTQIEKAKIELNKLLEKQEQMQREGKDSGVSWDRINEKIESTKSTIASAEGELKDLVDTGKAFTLGSNTEEYSKIGQQLKYTEASLETMNQQHEIAEARLEAALQKREAEKAKLRETINEEMRLAEIKRDATVEDQEIIDLLQRRKEVLQEITELEKAGVGEGYQEYYDAQGELSDIDRQINAIREARAEQEQMRSSCVGLKELVQNAFKIMAKGFRDIPIAIVKAGIKGITSAVRELGNVVQKSAVAPFKLLGTTAKKIFSSVGKSSKSSNNMFNKGFKNILKYGLGIRSFYALVNKLRTAIKEGFSNFANYSASFKSAVNGLKASALTLKNSFAAAFAPLVEMAIPYIQRVIDYLVKLMDVVGQVIAAITGQKKYTRAIKQTTAAIEDQNKAQNKQLSGLDKLNNMTSSSGGGGADSGAGGMFEEAPVDERWQNIAQWLKDMWEASDFYELGKLLGEKLKEALDNIPWDAIKEKARKIGKSLATLINGFIEVDGLGYSIGRTLAEAFNTGFEFLNAFVHELHWDSLGKFIAETLNGIFENIDWDLIYDTFVTGAKGLGDAINSFTDNLNWDAIATTISNFVNTFVDTIYTFLTTVDWVELGTKVGKTISDAWTGIDWAKAGATLGEFFKAFFDFIGKTIENIDWQEIGEDIKNFLLGIDWAGVAKSFSEAAGAIFGAAFGALWGFVKSAWDDFIGYWKGYLEDKSGWEIIKGLWNGIIDAISGIADWIYENIFIPFVEGFTSAFGIHSPSTVMEEMGEYIVNGLLNGLKNTWDSIVSWITDKIDWLKEKVQSILGLIGQADSASKGMTSGGLGGALGGAFGKNNYSYGLPPAMAALSNAEFPGYATGQVIPTNMKKHLAWLGDNNHETEVVSPLSTMKQANKEAILEVLSELGMTGGNGRSTGGETFVFQVDGKTFFEITRGEAQKYFSRTGRSPYPT